MELTPELTDILNWALCGRILLWSYIVMMWFSAWRMYKHVLSLGDFIACFLLCIFWPVFFMLMLCNCFDDR